MIYCQYLGFYNFLHLKLEFLYIGTYNKDTINKKREIKTMSLNTKKKILISGISVGLTTATAVAVGVPVSMNNHQQSSSTDVPTASLASYPSEDKFTKNITTSSNDDLNKQLSALFGSDALSSGLTSYFEGFASYKNVIATFDANSASVTSKTFTLIVTPKNGYKWSDGNNDGRKITVTLENLIVNSNDSTLSKDSSESLDGTYKISYSSFGDSIKDDATLNSFLASNFGKDKLGGTFDNVDVTYITDSAKFNGFTFEVKLTPTSGHAWSNDGTTTSRTKEISINFTDAIKDADAPSTDTLRTSVNIGKGTMSSATLQDALKSILDNGSLLNGLVSKNSYKNVDLSLPQNASEDGKIFKLTLTPKKGHIWIDGTSASKTISVTISNLVNNWDATLSATDTFTGKLSYSNQSSFTTSVSDLIESQGNNFVKFLQNGNSYKNVNIAYAPGTPSFSTRTFKLYVSPMKGHAWADNGTTGARVVTVTVPEDKTVKVSLPSDWSLDSLAWYYDYYKSGNQSSKDLDTIGRMAYKDMSASIKGFDYVGVDESQSSTFTPINNAYLQTVWIKVKLQSGYSWADGSSNSTRSIRVFLFSSKDMWKDFWANNNGGLNYKLTKDDNGLPTNIWVSNVLWNTNRFTSGTWDQNSELVKQAILGDLAKSFPGWRFTISNIQSNNYSLWNYFDYWTYNIHFENIANPNLTRDVKGYIFTQTN